MVHEVAILPCVKANRGVLSKVSQLGADMNVRSRISEPAHIIPMYQRARENIAESNNLSTFKEAHDLDMIVRRTLVW